MSLRAERILWVGISVALCGGGCMTTAPSTPNPDLTQARPDLGVTTPPDLLASTVDAVTFSGDLVTPIDLIAPTCSDGVKNGSETDVDCGGSCPKCIPGAKCSINADCISLTCAASTCAAATCNDQVKNGTETDLDCGGNACPKCGVNKSCLVASDCGSGVCTGNLCAEPSCTDGVRNGSETDIDCGGACPTKCGTSKTCNAGLDCVSGTCVTNLCATPSCTDGIKNGVESDVDCGGAACPKCIDGKACGAGTDCVSAVCAGAVCVAASCTDKQKNGGETDIDCGGPLCAKCAAGKSCLLASDCGSGVCAANVCAAATCSDKVKNGTETDVDCGGASCPACADMLGCMMSSDCNSKVCVTGKCVAPTCNDAVQNGSETDIDCGGAACPACGNGKACLVDNDCRPSPCLSNVCKYPISCNDILKHNANTASGNYTIQPTGVAVPLTVACDMTTLGGGWTQFYQCLPNDNCLVGSSTLFLTDWLANDYGAPSASKSYSVGKTLSSTINGASNFMLQITDTSSNKVGRAVYPLTADTVKFMGGGSGLYGSPQLNTILIDADGSMSQRSLRICFNVGSGNRSLQGATGLTFLGQTSSTPNDMPNANCDYGPWSAQILTLQPQGSGVSAAWGIPGPASWAGQPYAHRIFVK